MSVSGGVLPRVTILTERLQHFISDLAVGDTTGITVFNHP